MLVQGGAEVNDANLEVEPSGAFPCPPSLIFADGFDSCLA